MILIKELYKSVSSTSARTSEKLDDTTKVPVTDADKSDQDKADYDKFNYDITNSTVYPEVKQKKHQPSDEVDYSHDGKLVYSPSKQVAIMQIGTDRQITDRHSHWVRPYLTDGVLVKRSIPWTSCFNPYVIAGITVLAVALFAIIQRPVVLVIIPVGIIASMLLTRRRGGITILLNNQKYNFLSDQEKKKLADDILSDVNCVGNVFSNIKIEKTEAMCEDGDIYMNALRFASHKSVLGCKKFIVRCMQDVCLTNSPTYEQIGLTVAEDLKLLKEVKEPTTREDLAAMHRSIRPLLEHVKNICGHVKQLKKEIDGLAYGKKFTHVYGLPTSEKIHTLNQLAIKMHVYECYLMHYAHYLDKFYSLQFNPIPDTTMNRISCGIADTLMALRNGGMLANWSIDGEKLIYGDSSPLLLATFTFMLADDAVRTDALVTHFSKGDVAGNVDAPKVPKS